jgi:hypothetical protein
MKKYEHTLSLDFIAGLIAGEGSFMWIKQNKQEIAVFQLKMHVLDKKLVEMVRDGLNLDEPVHEYNHQNRHYVLLLVRKRKTIAEKIIPLLDGRLFGMKEIQFQNWKKKFEQRREDWLYKFI